jgi:heme-degrading monooxygenase HmoA
MNSPYITLTTSHPNPEQIMKMEAFLSKYLPRLERQPGVLAVYHYTRPEHGYDFTLIIWENQDALKSYREGSLIKEAIAFEKEQDLPAAREGYPLTFATAPKV